jgi:hypothetical protein
MRSPGAWLGLALLAAALPPAAAFGGPGAPKGPLNTIADVSRALHSCWQWPPRSEIHTGTEFTVLLNFKKNGEIFGARITYQNRNISDDEHALYYGALLAALARCSPLPLSASLGEAIAGRPLRFHIQDTRQQRKV